MARPYLPVLDEDLEFERRLLGLDADGGEGDPFPPEAMLGLESPVPTPAPRLMTPTPTPSPTPRPLTRPSDRINVDPRSGTIIMGTLPKSPEIGGIAQEQIREQLEAPESSGSISYSIGGGPMRSYNAQGKTRRARLGIDPDEAMPGVAKSAFGQDIQRGPGGAPTEEALNSAVDRESFGGLGYVPKTLDEKIRLSAQQRGLTPLQEEQESSLGRFASLDPRQAAELDALKKRGEGEASQSVSAMQDIFSFVDREMEKGRQAAASRGMQFDEPAARQKLTDSLISMLMGLKGRERSGLSLGVVPGAE